MLKGDAVQLYICKTFGVVLAWHYLDGSLRTSHLNSRRKRNPDTATQRFRCICTANANANELYPLESHCKAPPRSNRFAFRVCVFEIHNAMPRV